VTRLRIPPEAEPETSAADESTAREGFDDAERAAPAARRPAGPRLGVTGWLRWGWRTLTSMRTALVLLFLLAAGSIPGSLLPQDGTNPAGVSQ